MNAMERDVLVNEVLVGLQNAGDDHEAVTVERLAIVAGYWWKCTHESAGYFEGCAYVNSVADPKCGGCGRPRPEAR